MQRQLTDFKLPTDLDLELRYLDWRDMQKISCYDQWVSLKFWARNFSWTTYKIFFNHYGWLFNRIATLDSYLLDESLTKAVTQYTSDYFQRDLTNEITVRLQVIYHGSCVPLHIDPTRTVSLIYPLAHRHTSYTISHESTELVSPGMVNPLYCREVNRVSADVYPALVDVSNIHSVTFDAKSYTKLDPRISLAIKWKTLSFAELVK